MARLTEIPSTSTNPSWPSAEDHETRLSRAIVAVRSAQTHRTVLVVLGAGAVVLLTLWNDVPHMHLAIWLSSIMATTSMAALISAHILKRIDLATRSEIWTFQRWHFKELVVNSAVLGSGFWWIGFQGSPHAVFAITMIACLYAAGSMVNLSADFRSLVYCIVLNLGQGVLFFSGIAGNAARPEVAASLAAVAFLLISFGRVNARQFAESIRIRSENVALVAQLDAEKRVVEQALAAAQEANAAKSRFLAAASHDLRQPLHALSLFLGSLSLVVQGEEAGKLLRRIRETAEVLNEHFNSLLDLSRFDAGGIEVDLADFDSAALLKVVVEEIRPKAAAKGLGLSLSAEPCWVHSDELLIERVVRNLLSNAVRYTVKGTVSVIAEPSGDHILIAVIDSGPGILEEEQDKIFDEFVQLNNPGRRREHGVGLGLAIVRRIDALLDLRLRLRSTVGLGSRFEFELPLASVKPREQVVPQRSMEVLEIVSNDSSG